MAYGDDLTPDPGVPSFREKLVDFLSALVLVVLTILTAWNYTLQPGANLRGTATAADHAPMQYPAIPGPVFALDPGADTLPARRRSQAQPPR